MQLNMEHEMEVLEATGRRRRQYGELGVSRTHAVPLTARKHHFDLYVNDASIPHQVPKWAHPWIEQK